MTDQMQAIVMAQHIAGKMVVRTGSDISALIQLCEEWVALRDTAEAAMRAFCSDPAGPSGLSIVAASKCREALRLCDERTQARRVAGMMGESQR